MTLYKQLTLVILVLFAVTFLATVTTSTANLRQFLDNQLEVHAQDTATSLALSLSSPVRERDLPVIRSMVDAIFDRGYFQSITITMIDGEKLITRSSTASHGKAPEWFKTLIDLQAPVAKAQVMTGWKQAATVSVVSNPGYAYHELWSNTLDTFRLFAVMTILVLLSGILVIRLLLKPLQLVETQANAICNRSYMVQKTLPRTRELRRVVDAMNRLTATISSNFNEHSTLTERLREHAYRDPLTGLGNRRQFDRMLHGLVESTENQTYGALVLLELHDLEQINHKYGYLHGDQVLRRTSELVATRIGKHPQCHAFRTSGAGFGILLPGLCREDADNLTSMLSKDILQLRADGLVKHTNIANIGVAMWKPGDTTCNLLSEADIALRSAQSAGENTWSHFAQPEGHRSPVRGIRQWYDYLSRIIEYGDIMLDWQPVLSCDGQKLLHKEVLLRTKDEDGHDIAAGLFMPLAERLGMASDLDKLVIGTLLEYLASGAAGNSTYAVNLSTASLHDAAFIEWLCRLTGDHPDYTEAIVFEFPEFAFMKNIRMARNAVRRLNDAGFGCGIDHFGHGFHSFGYLSSIRLQYLKLDGSYISGIETDIDNRFIIQALTDTAHSVEIEVIAESIETAAQLETVKTLNIDGIQGFFAGKPEPLRLSGTGEPAVRVMQQR